MDDYAVLIADSGEVGVGYSEIIDRVSIVTPVVQSLLPIDPFAATAGTLGNQHTTITASTAEKAISPVEIWRQMPYFVFATNTSASACVVTFRYSTAGTTYAVLDIPAGDSRGFVLDPRSPLVNLAPYNSTLTAQCGSSVTSVEVTVAWVRWP